MATLDHSTNASKKRKLKYPRTAKACNFCKKRKIRCSGSQPCETCSREEIDCRYGEGSVRINTGVDPPQFSIPEPGEIRSSVTHVEAQPPPQYQITSAITSQSSRRQSFDPPQAFGQGHHVGPTAGLSFLYHNYNKAGVSSSGRRGHAEGHQSSSALTSYGDIASDIIDTIDASPQSWDAVRAIDLLEAYFRFATPTYRFMHRPTLEGWARLYTARESGLTNAEESCVLLACAQSLLYTQGGDLYASGGKDDIKLSRWLYEQARSLLDHEKGPTSTSSIQARLAMCLYLLGTFRMTECRFSFSFTTTLVINLGLHRRQSSTHTSLGILESEMRRRVFWCTYVLDGYLSVMHGRPRMFRDEDIDQPYPANVDDADLLSCPAMQVEDLPHHGNLEAFICHINLAKLMGRNNDVLYPLYEITKDDIIERASDMLDTLNKWRDGLPGFLKPRQNTLTGQRTFERQNTVLKLASAHLRILMTRRCLLTDFHHFGRTAFSPDHQSVELGASRLIQECVTSVATIIDATLSLIRTKSLHQSFWFTQYIVIVAISTLYIFLVQGARRGLPAAMDVFLPSDDYFTKAKECQAYLAAMAPNGSQAARHHVLLDRLKDRAHRDLAQCQHSQASSLERPNPTSSSTAEQQPYMPLGEEPSAPLSIDQYPLNSIIADTSLTAQLTSSSELDFGLHAMLDMGWEGLDTLGFLSNNGDFGIG